MTKFGGVAWECQRAVDAEVPVSFAWQFMTNVDNWSDPPAEFTLDGPFVAGARGTTSLPGQPAISWIISHVDVGRGYTIEGSELFERACLRIHWRFEAVTELGTRLTQHLELVGDNAAEYRRRRQVRLRTQPRTRDDAHRAIDGRRVRQEILTPENNA